MTNTVREDIIKTAKYHYGQGDNVMLIKRMTAVIAYHEGLYPQQISNSELLMKLIHATNDIVFKTTGDSIRFMMDCINNYRMNLLMNPSHIRNDGMNLMLNAYIDRLTFLDPVHIGGTLPDNCDSLANFINEFVK